MSKKEKYKYLLKNIGLLTISNFGSKILSFILIPLYTNVLTTEEYGTYDIYSTTISLLMPILTLNIATAVLRFSLEEQNNKRDVFTIAVKKCVLSLAILIILIILNNILGLFTIFQDFWTAFIFLYFSEVIYNLLSSFARGLEKMKAISISGLINSISILILNVVFLLAFKMGLKGYFIANIFGYIIPSIYLLISTKAWRYLKIKSRAPKLKKQMEQYSKPLIFNTIGWWITNVSDRYIVTWICGVAANGIYSVAYKIPSVLNIVQTIFNQAWTLSAVKEQSEDSGEFYTSIYKIYNIGLVMICSILIIADKIIAKILFAKDFYTAWKYAPFLMISVIFGALSGLLEGIFIAQKKTKIIATTTIIGAIINTVFNIIFVYLIGPIGAAISTLIAYIVVWLIRNIETNKVIKVAIDYKKDISSYILLIIQAGILLLNINSYIIYTVEICIFLILLGIYRREIGGYIHKLLNFKKKK